MVLRQAIGIGIEKDKIPLLFQKENRTMELGTFGEMGNGLGLSFCYDILQAHGAKIYIESEMNKGSTFIIQQPYHEKILLIAYDSHFENNRVGMESINNYLILRSYNEEIFSKILNQLTPDIILIQQDAYKTYQKYLDKFQLLDNNLGGVYIYGDKNPNMENIEFIQGKESEVIRKLI